MKKLFMKFCVVVLSCFMVFNTAYLPSYAEDEMSYYEQNDLANSFRYSNGEAKDMAMQIMLHVLLLILGGLMIQELFLRELM